MTRRARILLADGDLASTAAARGALEAAHYVVRVCAGAPVLPQRVATFRPDLVIMDLPVNDPPLIAEVVRQIHASYRPLLLCMLKDGLAQRTPALEAGADACIERPFTAEDLEVHVRALLRRTPWLERTVHEVGRLVIDLASHVTLFDERPITLSSKEFDILAMLAANSGVVLSKRALLDGVWGFDAYDENLVEVHMSALRRCLPTDAREMIHTIRSVGYVLRDEVPQGQLA